MTIGYGNWISLHSTSVFASQCTVFYWILLGCVAMSDDAWSLRFGNADRCEMWQIDTNWHRSHRSIWFEFGPEFWRRAEWCMNCKRANLWFTLSISELGVLLTWCHLLDDKKELRTDWTDFFGLLKKIAILQHKIASGITTTNYHNYHHHQLAEVLFSGSWQPWRVSAVQVLQHFSCPLSNQRPWNSQGHHWPCLMDIHKLKNRLEKNVMISYDFFKAI